MEFKEAIREVRKKQIVLNVIDDEPVILKHDTSGFQQISDDELLETFNDNYDGADVHDISDIKKELQFVEISFFQKGV
jgi:hypothetical protein